MSREIEIDCRSVKPCNVCDDNHHTPKPAIIGSLGSCQLNGHDVPGFAIGVLKNEAGVEMLPAVSAWKIDEKQMKFVKLETEGLRCSRDGISTADGGL